ncbi:hypothetical protein EXS70_01010 [Candidatus Peribacteria bacterium]|nr:hypothetical protein [Candidatus Peribacteria bacterium]
MEHTNSFFGFRSCSFREARLCHELEQLVEVLTASKRMQENVPMSEARALYDNAFLLRANTELTQSTDRAYFQALVLSGMRRNQKVSIETTIGNRNRSAIQAFDVAQLLPQGTGMPPEADLRKAGERLREVLTPAQRLQLHTNESASDIELGLAYFNVRNRWMQEWDGNHNVHDRPRQLEDPRFDVLIQSQVQLYLHSRTTLDAHLNTGGITLPGIESSNSPGQRLTRSQYVALLALVWKGQGQEVLKVATGGADTATRITDLQGLINRNGGICVPVQHAYDRLVPGELGSTEALLAMNIRPGPNLSIQYIAGRRGRQPQLGTPEAPVGPDRFRSPPLRTGVTEAQVFRRIDPAATWRNNPPPAAIEFLEQHMPNEGGNTNFIKALKFHFGTPAMRATVPAAPMTRDATLAILAHIVDMLTEHERVTTQSTLQAEQLKKNINVTQTINDFAGNMSEIVRDYQNNPVLAAAVVAGGFFAIRAAYKLIKGDYPAIVNWAGYIGLGGLALGLYQERQTGTAWWNGLGDLVSDFYRGEAGLPPERQTLPNYWARELQLNNAQTVACLSILQQDNVSTRTVCGYYADMEAWNGTPATQPALPPSFNIAAFRNRFGAMDDKAIGRAIHQTLKAFFRNRGEGLAKQGFEYRGREGGAEALGFVSIRNRYNGSRVFSLFVDGEIRIPGINLNPRLITDWNGRENQVYLTGLHRDNPTAHGALLALRAIYVEELRTAGTPRPAHDFKYVLLFEGGPGLETMGRNGVRAAGFLDVGQRFVTDTLHQYSPTEPGPPERSPPNVRLLRPGSAETTLITDNSYLRGGRFGQLAAPSVAPLIPPGVLDPILALAGLERARFKDTLQRDWAEFLPRLNLTPRAAQALTKYMNGRITSWTGSIQELLTYVADQKYQLLIAAASSNESLSQEVVTRLSGSVLPDVIRWINPLPGETFPNINTLADVESLFDITINGGGTPSATLWRRIFPLWQGSDFAEIRKQITEMRAELVQLRQLPDLALPGASGAAGTTSMENLEKFMALSISNHLVGLSLYALNGANTFVPDVGRQRIVSANERASLSTYISELKQNLIAPDALKRLAEFNDRANAVEAYWSGANLKVTVTQGVVSLSMNVGAALPGRFLTPEQRANTRDQRRFERDITTNDLATMTPQQIVERWRKQAFDTKMQQVTKEMPVPVLNASIDGSDVLWQLAANVAGNGRTPMQDFLTTPTGTLHSKYTQWSVPGVDRVARPNPLSMP